MRGQGLSGFLATAYPLVVFYPVWSLLKKLNFPNNMCNLEIDRTIVLYLCTTIYLNKYTHLDMDTHAHTHIVKDFLHYLLIYFAHCFLTILIFEKLTRLSSVTFGVPSSIKERSVRYIPKYGIHGGSHL